MLIMAFDIASTKTGFACGRAGSKPRVQTWLLRRHGESVETAAVNFGRTLRDQIEFERPDLIAVEDYLNPQAQPSADAAIASIGLHFALIGVVGLWGIRVEGAHVDTIRRHFCGKSSALPRTRGPKTSQQKAAARQATKEMVLKRAKLLGYLPHDCFDDNKADACAIFDYACATWAGVRPRELVMFGEEAAP